MKKQALSLGGCLVLLVSIIACSSSGAAATTPTAVQAGGQEAPTISAAATVPPFATLIAGLSTEAAVGTSSIQWPSKMPQDVPQFTYGTIAGSNNDVMGSVQASFNKVTPDAFTKYQNDLKSAGWAITNATQSADGSGEIDAAKAPRGIVVLFIPSKNNGLRAVITYNNQSGG
jgi:hypothetical protein